MVLPLPKKLRCKFGSDGCGSQSKNRNMDWLSDFSVHEKKTNDFLREAKCLLVRVCMCVRV